MGSLNSHNIKKQLRHNSAIQIQKNNQNITGIHMMKFTIKLPVRVKHYSVICSMRNTCNILDLKYKELQMFFTEYLQQLGKVLFVFFLFTHIKVII